MSEPAFHAIWREFETEVKRDGYFGRRPSLEDIMRRMRSELTWARLLPPPDECKTCGHDEHSHGAGHPYPGCVGRGCDCMSFRAA